MISGRRIELREYLIWSTIISVFLFIPLMPLIQIGYLIAIVNSLILIWFGELALHRNHFFVICSLAIFSLIGATFSGTPLTAIISEILGITVMSGYYLCALAAIGPSVKQWMELYMRAALALAVLSLALWPITVALHLNAGGRLKGIYSEPSFYIYVTLPALGYCINCFATARRYGWETLIFLLSYALADSSLGFLGIFLIGALTYFPRIKRWQILVAGITALGLLTGLYFASANVRLRANDMARAMVTQDLTGSDASTFALLSNVYVATRSFIEHPLIGLGIGGYAKAYDTYIGDVSGMNLNSMIAMNLNREDANSMFLRVAAELGIPGLVALFSFLFICARVRGAPYVHIRNALLPYLLVRCGRLGAYFSTELFFFVGLYLFNYLNYRASLLSDAHPQASYSVEKPAY